MKKTAIAALAGVLMSGNALASQFDGAYIGLSAGSYGTTSGVRGPGDSIEFGEDGKASAIGLLAGYGKTFKQFYVGGELNYRNSYGKSKGEKTNQFFELDLGRSYSASVMPGYLVKDDVLIYGRFSYGVVQADSKYYGSGTPYGRVDSFGKDINVTGVGLGVDYALKRNFSVRGEFNSLSYSSYTKTFETYWLKPQNTKTTGFEISALYRF